MNNDWLLRGMQRWDEKVKHQDQTICIYLGGSAQGLYNNQKIAGSHVNGRLPNLSDLTSLRDSL